MPQTVLIGVLLLAAVGPVSQSQLQTGFLSDSAYRFPDLAAWLLLQKRR